MREIQFRDTGLQAERRDHVRDTLEQFQVFTDSAQATYAGMSQAQDDQNALEDLGPSQTPQVKTAVLSKGAAHAGVAGGNNRYPGGPSVERLENLDEEFELY